MPQLLERSLDDLLPSQVVVRLWCFLIEYGCELSCGFDENDLIFFFSIYLAVTTLKLFAHAAILHLDLNTRE